MNNEGNYRLTQYSRGAGCGCKIAPDMLQQILKTESTQVVPELLLGNSHNEDAAVYDIGDNKAVISTADFFMPIVDDAFDFGRIASANAISDVYAMGGKPLMAIAILGWPVEKLPAHLAASVLEGARNICSKAGIPLAGGHSIDSTEPIFGLSVTGIIKKENIKQNNTAKEGDLLFITKPIGTGILSTAQKRDVITEDQLEVLVKQMVELNFIGEALAQIDEVTAMTDVTGFGLLGHAIEMAEGANLSLELYYSNIPVIEGAKEFVAKRIVPDATYRNWNSYSTKTAFDKGVNVMEAFNLLPDPQTNGGIMFSVKESAAEKIIAVLDKNNLSAFTTPIGKFVPPQEKTIQVKA
jgi:selenide,water dikinase